MLTSVNDPDNYTRMTYAGHPDVLVESIRMFYAYKCRLNFLEAIRIRKARHVYLDEGDPMVMCVTCHHEVRDTCSQEEGSLQL